MPINTILPEWNKAAEKPAQYKLDEGWKAQEKPPASVFNWFFNTTYHALLDIIDQTYTKTETDTNITAAENRAKQDATSKANAAETNAKNASTPIAHVGTGGSSHAAVTTNTNGFMIAADKAKLDTVQKDANYYIHPATHPATMIVEDANHRFATDTEKAYWNAKASTQLASPTVNGLMSMGDKSKLDGIANNANNYVHPATHPASMIVQDSTRRMVSDLKISSWDTHLNRVDNPHNVTSEQINRTTPKNADVPGTEYPRGVTMFQAPSDAATSGYPMGLGTVLTVNEGDYRMFQWFVNSDVTKDRIWLRNFRSANGEGWSEFTELESTAGSQAKADAVKAIMLKYGIGATDLAQIDGQDLNNILTGGFYRGGTLVNAPVSSVMHIEVIASNANTITQNAHALDTNTLYSRTKSAGTWSAWKTIETTAGAQAKADAAETNAKNASIPRTGSWVSGLLKFEAGQEGIETGEGPTKGINWTFGTDVFNLFGRTAASGENNGLVLAMGDNNQDYFQIEQVSPGGEATPQKLFRISEYDGLRTWTPIYENDKRVSTTEDAQNRANTAETNAKNWVKSFGLGGPALQITADISTYINSGFYRFDRSDTRVTGAPSIQSGEHTWMYMLVIGHSNEWVMQMVWDFNNKNHYTRIKNNGTWNGWKSWASSDDAQARATQAKNDALSAMNNVGIGASTTPQVTDLNALVVQGYYYFRGTAVGAPRDAGGVVQHIPSSGTNYAIQIAYLDATNTVLQRTKRNGTWSSWLQTAGNMTEGWRDLTPYGGAQPYGSGTGPQVMRVGDIIFLRGALTNITSRQQSVLTLPGDCRPSRDWQFMANISIGANYQARFARWNIRADGTVVMDYVQDNSFDANWWSVNTVFSMGG